MLKWKKPNPLLFPNHCSGSTCKNRSHPPGGGVGEKPDASNGSVDDDCQNEDQDQGDLQKQCR